MAAKWQQWMPLYIDRFLGSEDVQMMEADAFKGYVCLLLAAWQTDDCTLPINPDELARKSRLGAKKWAKFGAEVMRKFRMVTVTVSGTVTERYRNDVEFEIWTEAKRVFDARSAAGNHTNKQRSPTPKHPGDRSGDRSAKGGAIPPTVTGTVTGTGTGTGGTAPAPPDPTPPKPDPTPEPPYDPNADPADTIPDGLSLVQYAIFVLSEAGVPASYTLKVKTGDAIEILAKDEACGLPVATRRMLDRMRKAAEGGPVKWNFWLEDGGWKQEHGNGTNQSSAAKQRIDGNLKALREAAQRRGISGTPDAGGADGETLCDAGCERVNRGLLTGLRATMPEIFAPAIPVGAGGIADQPRAEVLPPAGRSGG
jgi:uncharacterized protein YdaU (DUF1376 family)